MRNTREKIYDVSTRFYLILERIPGKKFKIWVSEKYLTRESIRENIYNVGTRELFKS